MLSLILFPVSSKLEDFGVGRITSTAISIVGLAAIILLIFYFFSRQIISLTSQFSEFEDRLSTIFQDSVRFMNEKIPIIPKVSPGEIIEKSKDWVGESGMEIMSVTVDNTASFFLD